MYKMPSKKKKYNARFPAGRIKKIMQTDEEVGKVAQAVPVIISRTLELFVESLLIKSTQITISRNAKTLTPSHMKQCILAESRFDFLKDLVKNIPDASAQEDNDNNLLFDSAIENQETSNTTNVYEKQACSHRDEKKSGTVIRYGRCVGQDTSCPTTSSRATKRTYFRSASSSSSKNSSSTEQVSNIFSVDDTDSDEEISDDDETSPKIPRLAIEDVPPLVPISSQSRNDVLVIDEDYDN